MIDICRDFWGYLTTLEFQLGMLFAASLILLLTLIWTLCVLIMRKGCDSIKIPGENGDLIVTRRALNAFISNALKRFSGFQLAKLVLRSAGKDGYIFKLSLRLMEGSEIVQQEKIREILMEELRSKLNIADKVKRMDIIIISVPADKEASEKEIEVADEDELK